MTRDLQKKKQALIEFIENGDALRTNFTIDMVRGGLPPEWDDIDLSEYAAPKKGKLTLRLDEDIISFFRGMGPGYAKLVNRVLRTYMTGRISNALFVREQSISVDELVIGYRHKSTQELQDMAEMAKMKVEMVEAMKASMKKKGE
ncbi:MAG: BrnA antitoxin family protein [Pseudomonadota bacterium]